MDHRVGLVGGLVSQEEKIASSEDSPKQARPPELTEAFGPFAWSGEF